MLLYIMLQCVKYYVIIWYIIKKLVSYFVLFFTVEAAENDFKVTFCFLPS